MTLSRTWFCVYIGVLGILVLQCLLPVAKKIGVRLGMVDPPGERKVHELAMLRSGGMALYFTFVLLIVAHLAAVYIFYMQSWFQNAFPVLISNLERLQIVQRPLIALLVGSTIIYMLGFFDDKKTILISLKTKWLVQLLAALIALWGGIYVTFTGFPLLDKLITVLWIIGITNAFNLLDNMNGLVQA